MATDKSEPRVGLIFGIALLAVTILLGLHSALNAYFDRLATDEIHRKLGETQPVALESLRMSERERLTAGALPISAAMSEMASHGRAAASPEIAATTSRDTAPLAGWTKMSADVPPAMAAPPPEPAASAAPDGGAKAAEGKAIAPDAGVRRLHKAPAKRNP